MPKNLPIQLLEEEDGIKILKVAEQKIKYHKENDKH
jgi:hypothetical protein